MRTRPTLPHSAMRTTVNLLDSSAAYEPPPGLLDVLLEIGKQRQQILVKMKEAVEKGDREAVFHCAEELVGWDRDLKSREIEGNGSRSGGTGAG